MDKELKMDDDFEIIRGSGNVFHDFGRSNTNLEQARALVAKEIICTLDERGLSTRDAEKLTGVAHSEFSHIRNAKLGRFTLDRLITILEKLDESIELEISFHPRSHGEQHALWLNLPKSLHSSLAQSAAEEGVPLDTLLLTMLSEKNSTSNLVGNVYSKFDEINQEIQAHRAETKELKMSTELTYSAVTSITTITPASLYFSQNGGPFNSIISSPSILNAVPSDGYEAGTSVSKISYKQ